VAQIRAWAKAHRERTGRWPGNTAGPILDAPGETWAAVGLALRRGRRDLPGGMSLAQLFGAAGGEGLTPPSACNSPRRNRFGEHRLPHEAATR
jgi:hypothetical protein